MRSTRALNFQLGDIFLHSEVSEKNLVAKLWHAIQFSGAYNNILFLKGDFWQNEIWTKKVIYSSFLFQLFVCSKKQSTKINTFSVIQAPAKTITFFFWNEGNRPNSSREKLSPCLKNMVSRQFRHDLVFFFIVMVWRHNFHMVSRWVFSICFRDEILVYIECTAARKKQFSVCCGVVKIKGKTRL